MHWTEQEIRTSYRDAKNKSSQIGIIASCNACDPDEIRVILGLIDPEQSARSRTDQIIELYNQGKTDVEIAEILSTERSAVYYIRTKHKLQANVKITEETEDDRTIMKLYKKGWCDSQIGMAVNRLERGICYWRKQRGLKSNRKRGERK